MIWPCSLKGEEDNDQDQRLWMGLVSSLLGGFGENAGACDGQRNLN